MFVKFKETNARILARFSVNIIENGRNKTLQSVL